MFSEKTENLGLPQWTKNDHPAFLTDMNQAFKKIDETVGPQGDSLDALQKKVDTLSDLTTSHTEDITTLQNDTSDQAVQIQNLQAQTAQIPGLKQSIDTANANYRVLSGEVSEHETEITGLISMLTKVSSATTLNFSNGISAEITMRGPILNVNFAAKPIFNYSTAGSDVFTATASDVANALAILGIDVNSIQGSLVVCTTTILYSGGIAAIARATFSMNDKTISITINRLLREESDSVYRDLSCSIYLILGGNYGNN